MGYAADTDSPDYPTGAAAAPSLGDLHEHLIECRACPRLVWARENIPARGYPDQRGWDKPVPGFGDPAARIAIVGLAPSADGSNRTGRVFTGDPSGDFLYTALHAVGMANHATAVSVSDGLALTDCYITASVKCLPPANKPTTTERHTCNPYLSAELELLAPTLRVLIALGGFGWHSALQALAHNGWAIPRPKPKFGHGAVVVLSRLNDDDDDASLAAAPLRPEEPGSGTAPVPPVRQPPHRDATGLTSRGKLTLLGCYHTSPQNTNTGKLTPTGLIELFQRAQSLSKNQSP